MNLWRLAWLWFVIGLQSFGGGTATLFLIRRMAVDQFKWLTPDAFTRDWSLVQAAPGIILVCLMILVGRRVGDHPEMDGFVRGLGLAVSGIFLVVVLRIMRENGIDVSSVLILLVSIGLTVTGRMPVPLLLVLAGVAGALIY